MTAPKEKTYRAIARGENPVGVWHEPGAIFTTTAIKGKWMEEVEPEKKPEAKARAD